MPSSDDRDSPAAPRLIMVMGVSGSGKSTIGQALARALGAPFLEGDAFHLPSSIDKMSNGIPLSDDDRWPWLDRLGQAMGETASQKGICIAACSALKRAYRDRLRAAAGQEIEIVYLDGSPEILAQRHANREGHFMPTSLLKSQFDLLEKPEADECAIRLTTDAKPQEIVKLALRQLKLPS